MDYMMGNWTVESNLTREQLYNYISPHLSDMVDRIRIKKTLGQKILPGFFIKFFLDVGYEKFYIDPGNATELLEKGIILRRCDYSKYLKCFCLETDQEFYPLGSFHQTFNNSYRNAFNRCGRLVSVS